jgi:hypothetical protein
MVWHIFKKDLRLLWPLAAVIAGLQALLGVLLYRSEPYSSQGPEGLSGLIALGLIIAMSLLIVLAVQQDAIPSLNQDWLVRPIKRRDLLLAKLLGIALLVHGPIAVMTLLQGLAEGFSFGQLLPATLLSAFEIALVFSLPVMVIAALTKNMTEAIVVSLAILVSLMVARLAILTLLFPITHAFHFESPTEETGLAWVWRSLSHALLLLATATVLGLQYFRRSTRQARAIAFGGMLLFMLAPALPWQPAFAIQQWFSGTTHADRSIAIAVDPAMTDAVDADTRILISDSDEKAEKTGGKDTIALSLPLRFSGLPDGSILHADRSAIRVVRADGSTLYRATGHPFDVRPRGSDGQAVLRQSIDMPPAIYRRLADQTLQLEVSYSLTLLRSQAQLPLAALDGDRRIPKVGHCASRIDSAGTAIEVSCLAAGELPPCISMILVRGANDRRDPEKFDCALNYQPGFLRFSSESIDHSKNKLPLHEAADSAHQPLNDTQLRDSTVILQVYEPEGHFSRGIVVPRFRPRDWKVSIAAAAEPPTS